MFDSGITASNLIESLVSEVDIAYKIPNKTYIIWLNSLEQLLYSEIIKEQKKITINSPASKTIAITSITKAANEEQARFEDIYTIFADGTELTKTTLNSSSVFINTYHKAGNNIGINTEKGAASKLEIIYFVRPALKTVNTNDIIGSGNIMLPYEFIDIVEAKLRGEAYKLMNEDNLAAKWLNDYNVLLESLKTWIGIRQPNFGM